MELIDWATGALVGIPATMGLAAVALIGYLFGRRSRQTPVSDLSAVGPRQLHRAARVARQLEDTIDQLRKQIAEHRSYVDRFKLKLDEAAQFDPSSAVQLLSTESDQVIVPTLRLASRLSHTYDELRLQSKTLSNFTEGRTDAATGLGNTPALEEQLRLAINDHSDKGWPAAILLLSVAPPADVRPGSDAHHCFVKHLAAEIEHGVRDQDYLARLGGTEFAILLSNTSLATARVVGGRLRNQLADHGQLAAACGIADVLPADTHQSWLSRADSALYSARATGRSAQFHHTGITLQADRGPTCQTAVATL